MPASSPLHTSAWDEDVMRWVAGHRTEWMSHVAFGVMDVGTTLAGVAVCVLVAAAFVRRSRLRWAAAAGVVAFVVAGLLAAGLKQLVGRPRPPAGLALVRVSGSSFPSAQAAETAAVAVALLVATAWSSRTMMRSAVAGAVVVLAVIGGCMVYLGAHWMSDVLAGWLLGASCGCLAGRVARGMAARSPHLPVPGTRHDRMTP